ncbi:putative aldehyde dehydrogenase-like protein [Alternaria arborescens]|uniref:Putative aldehyde dehydrogenase-like protein n=1 Tax=Alternaria arborescens TaxID=156630 RepID=A0A4Q4QXN9_9PLEO|nr:putative aldehyde dehydrogenase-like protein [Alternaria arborescens]
MAQSIELTAPNGTKWTQPTGLFINNEFVPSKSGSTLETINPYDELVIAKVSAGSEDDIDAAVTAARTAFKSSAWRDLSAAERGQLLWKLGDLCEKNSHILATIDAWDNGKPYQQAMDEDVAETISVFRYYAGWADKVYGQTIETSNAKLAYTKHEPLGVCGQIIPWNFPVMMAAWKLGPALACGNTVVLKPAEQTPLSALFLASLIKEAGFPSGVVNIVNGYGKGAGSRLSEHPYVDKIAFTGSTITGRSIMKAAANNLKNITLETGGKSPLLVFDDCDLDQTVKWSHMGIMGNSGQVCTATSRLYVQDTIYDKFLEAFKKQIKENTKIGSQFDADTNHGPQISKAAQQKILSYVDTARSDGAELIHGGKQDGIPEKGYFVEPAVFANCSNDMRIVREEIFGPFVVIQSFKTEDEAVEKANDTEFGLGAAVFTKDIMRGHRVAGAVEAGMVWINSSQDSHFGIPFGGYKQSGIGRELGAYALSSYTQVKAVHVNLGTFL